MNSLSRYFVLSPVLLFVAGQAEAVNVSYAIDSGVSYSDNIFRSEANQVKDTVVSIGGSIDVVDESSRNDFVLGLNVARLNYKDNTFEDEIISNVDLASSWSLVDDAFTWDVDGYFGQQAINAFAVRTPDNLQDTGFLSTGPDLIVRFTNLDTLTIGYRYNDFYAERTDADYQSNLINVSLDRRLSPIFVIGLNASHDDLVYEDTTNDDFEDTRYFISLGGSSVSTQYSLELGQINIRFEDGTEAENSLKRFSIARQMNRNNNISFQVSETIDNGAAAVNNNTVTTSVTTGLFVNELAQLTYNYNRGDIQVNFGYSYSNQDYLTQNIFDQRIRTSAINFVYGSPLDFQYQINYQYVDTDFYGATPAQRNKENTVTFSLGKRLTRSVNIEASIENYVRESNTQTQDIEENVFMLTLSHQSRI